MNIKAAYLAEGIIIGDVTESISGDSFTFDKPILVQPSRDNILMIDYLGMFEEEQFTIKKSDLRFNSVFTPVPELVNAYNQRVNPKAIVTPSSKIIV